MLRILTLSALVIVGCSAPAPATQPTPGPLLTPTTVRPTAVPTATLGTNYAALRSALRNPLSSLIVAVRAGDSANAAVFLAEFNTAADLVLARIANDVSPQANSLHSAVVNVRATPGNLAVLERERAALLSP